MRTYTITAAVLLSFTACQAPDPDPDGGEERDARVDAYVEPECDTSCDDGVFCNGVEACVAGECSAGDAPCAESEWCDEAASSCRPTCDDDDDGDGIVSSACGGEDCDDADPARSPSGTEVCDAVDHDEDCDPATVGARDLDADGSIDAACCNADADGELHCGSDCNDLRADAEPGATEACNGFDDDCDGIVDEGVDVAGFADADRDGRGDPAVPLRACADANGFSIHDDDCNDANSRVHGVAAELCDTVDNDCDDAIDEAAVPVTWYADADRDGFGNPRGATTLSCAPVAGYETLATDCNDASAAISPRVPEICNGADDDCAGGADFRIDVGDGEDDDGDGVPDAACAPAGTAADCDDRDPFAKPGADEICNGRDDDCDGVRDEACVECVTDVHCATGGRCVGNRCETSCGPAGECPSGSTCCGTACVDTRTNGAHCGGCESPCVLFSAFGGCEDSECAVTACRNNFGDCDDDSANGCEVNLRNSVAHCGACGHACRPPHAVPTCTDQACRIAACTGGWLDCDGVPENGCETDPTVDDLNCGGCGRICTPDRRATDVECLNGACRVVACEEGAYDCNRGAGDGCEFYVPPPIPGCTNVARAAPVGGFPAFSNPSGIDTARAHDGAQCGLFEYSNLSSQIDVDLGPGPHSLRRISLAWSLYSSNVEILTSVDGTTYVSQAFDPVAPATGVTSANFATPRDARHVRFRAGNGFYFPFTIAEIAIFECP